MLFLYFHQDVAILKKRPDNKKPPEAFAVRAVFCSKVFISIQLYLLGLIFRDAKNQAPPETSLPFRIY
ncbi:MAG: hypothetical protein A3H57_02550 [Candidatus Taylorbacteria bacterium RIFCSPLOWO2_02_FULL_43_11]|uniref:Uncharacterized protein n=1 Tax=Candidatus Taylorbacteria bacterium RIFCSPHIGHO2_02_FULL_43_32b TaxID=1802306 RepID=A0A1G2MFZ7_9BACT|nr:MAG: hypothetical protein A3C72_02745 [Candidatus Taylorbacteria bacterium RIFCSPHIGHO2_02_FULL_43_32b]OHA30863.1 MAG: hypothetical protein A3B08_01555 [Candidatus Taylorbacteria bacterium RIFCSPLOWO2_01_FULL_43_44]OHA35259.1 MAG: hypothetical protein A3H57_02550 [Candidatus Taylorbacteria bacterium RIFCSPLOWO2_02_FULL_43_11]